MTDQLHVAIAQSPSELIGPQARVAWLEGFLHGLRGREVDLVVLPELFLTGYNIGDRVNDWAEERDGPMSRRVAELARVHGLAIHYGFAERDSSDLFNAAACYGYDGHLIGFHRKLLLPPGFEGDHFAAGGSYALFQVGAFNVATLICYDAEFPENFRIVASGGANLVVVPTALSADWGVVAEKLIPTRAFENGVFVCYANHCGEENGLSYYGGSCIVGPDGQDLVRAGQNEACLVAQLNLTSVKAAQTRLPYLVDRLKLPRV